MKAWISITLAALLLFGAGCTASPGGGRDAGQGATFQGPVVYASIYPLYDFAAKIAGDRARVELLSSGGSEPHDWEPAPGDITALERADLFLYNGAGLEPWVDTVLGALQNDSLQVVEAAASLPLLAGTGHSHDEDHDEDEDGHDHDHGGADPHLWLSPANAKIQMRAIADALTAADPEGADLYEENYRHWAEELDELDQEYRQALDPLPHREIVVAHQAFGYLCRDYDLEQVAVRGFSPDGEPDPGRMAQVISWARDHGVKVIFFESAQSSRVAQTVADEIGAGTAVLNPIEFLTAEQQAAGADYFSLMRENLEALTKALA